MAEKEADENPTALPENLQIFTDIDDYRRANSTRSRTCMRQIVLAMAQGAVGKIHAHLPSRVVPQFLPGETRAFRFALFSFVYQ